MDGRGGTDGGGDEGGGVKGGCKGGGGGTGGCIGGGAAGDGGGAGGHGSEGGGRAGEAQGIRCTLLSSTKEAAAMPDITPGTMIIKTLVTKQHDQAGASRVTFGSATCGALSAFASSSSVHASAACLVPRS